MHTYDEKFETVKYYHSLLKWFNKKKIEKSLADLITTINDLSRNKKLNSLMHLYFVDRSVFPQDFNVYSIISECLSDDISWLNLMTRYQNKIKDQSKFSKIKSDMNMFLQFIHMELGIYLKSPQKFASAINDYFTTLSKREIYSDLKVEYLGFCTLPSFFGFFSIPDLYQYVYQLSSSFITMESLSILNDYFCASFFFNTPKFLNFLWDDYFHQFLTTSTKYSPFKYYEFFLHSLKKATNFLVTYHYLIAKQIYDISPERFVRMMIKLIFLPTLEIRIISDAASHIYEIDQISCFTSLKYVFNYILEKPFLIGFSRSLLNALQIKTDTELNSQYVHPFNVVKFNCYSSIRELIFLAEVFSNPGKNSNLYKHQQLPEYLSKNNSIVYNELYFTKPSKNQEMKPNWNTIFYQDDKLFINSKEIEIANENENFSRLFIEFQSSLIEKGINIVSLIDDRFPIAQDKMSIVNYYRKCHPILSNPEFKDFVITKVHNEYCNFFKILENKMIINNITQSIYEDDLDSVKRLHYMSLNAFIAFDDCFSTKSMRYKLFSLPSIKENMFDEILKYLMVFTMHYSNSIYEVFSAMNSQDNFNDISNSDENSNIINGIDKNIITNSFANNNNDNNNADNINNNDDNNIKIRSSSGSLNSTDYCKNGFAIFELDAFQNMKFIDVKSAFKKIQQLKNICNYVIKMEMPDRIVVYSKLFRYIHEFIISQNPYTPVKDIDTVLDYDNDYYHHFILIVIYLFCGVDLLLNLYKTYCTFFKFAFSQFDDDDDKEISEVKSEWIRFQNVLKKTLFKGNDEYMNICFIQNVNGF